MIAADAAVVAHHPPYQRMDLGPQKADPGLMPLPLDPDIFAVLRLHQYREHVWGLVVQACGGER